ncbi:MAG: S-layer homology domain-containing protein [Bacillota bacterium]|nr:S-layer homology domain-containing protein [Bacillota bacterium]
MKLKRVFSVCLAAALILSCLPQTAWADSPTVSLQSITWQDPYNTVLLWDDAPGCTYQVYRADSRNGSYTLLGTADCGSYRDETAAYPQEYYYKIQATASNGSRSALSEPMKSGTNPQKLDCVTVIMYHHFITEQDIRSGVKYDEYSVSPEDFEEDLKYLKNNGYTTITSDDLAEYLHGRKLLPAKAVLISIDDGTEGVYTNAWPLLKKYRMKADLNIIGEQIDQAWQTVHDGKTRVGEEAPYCTWDELKKMSRSGEINICSHTYGMHRYNRSGRIGAQKLDTETVEEYTAAVKSDFDKVTRSLTGWTGIVPRTMAYPYSRRSKVSDDVILGNTSYEILMAGEGARGTQANYFVQGTDFSTQLTLISRPCRMDGTPLKTYLENVQKKDSANGVNKPQNTLLLSNEECTAVAAQYPLFDDVNAKDWYSGSTYYAYVNGILLGTSVSTFSPKANVSRGMTATLLYRMAGSPASAAGGSFADLPSDKWYTVPALWAAANDILPGANSRYYCPNDEIPREEVAKSLYQFAKYSGMDCTARADLSVFRDAGTISADALPAMEWAVAEGIFKGNGDNTLSPLDNVTRGQMATILMNWNRKVNK